jgi:hypothetical protein
VKVNIIKGNSQNIPEADATIVADFALGDAAP